MVSLDVYICIYNVIIVLEKINLTLLFLKSLLNYGSS